MKTLTIKKITGLVLIVLFNGAHAVGVPVLDMAGTLTLAKTNLTLEPGNVVNLVALNSNCHYVGATQLGSDGEMEIIIEIKTCNEITENVKVPPTPMKGPIKVGDIVWIPIDGIVERIEEVNTSGKH